MKLVILQDYLRNGGTEQQTLAIAQGLAERGVEVHLIIFRKGGVLEAKAAELPLRIHFLPQGPFTFDWFAPRLSATLKQIRPDLALAMGRMANCHAGLLSWKNLPFPLICSFRTGRSIPYLYRKGLKSADWIVANSHEALTRLNHEYGIHRPDTASVIYNGCIRDFPADDSQEPTKADSTVRFCSISMFRPQKKQIRLIRICAKLPASIDWRLTLAGDGPTLDECKTAAANLGVTDRVQFPGLVADPTALFRESDIALHASDSESLPNFLVEAQMAGLPVVAYDVNGVSETFRDQTSGLLVKHLDEAGFEQALIRLARDRCQREKMSQAARAFATDRFSRDTQSEAYFQLCKKASGLSVRE